MTSHTPRRDTPENHPSTPENYYCTVCDLPGHTRHTCGQRRTTHAPMPAQPTFIKGQGWVPGSRTQIEPDSTRSKWGRPPPETVSADTPEPPVWTVLLDCGAFPWVRTGSDDCDWKSIIRVKGRTEPHTWVGLNQKFGPLTIVNKGPRHDKFPPSQ